MSGYISKGVIVFLHWLPFVIIEVYCQLLDFKVYSVVECRFPSRPNAVSQNVNGSEIKYVDPPPRLVILSNLAFFFSWLMQETLPPSFTEVGSFSCPQSCLQSGKQIETNHAKNMTTLAEVI